MWGGQNGLDTATPGKALMKPMPYAARVRALQLLSSKCNGEDTLSVQVDMHRWSCACEVSMKHGVCLGHPTCPTSLDVCIHETLYQYQDGVIEMEILINKFSFYYTC